MNLDQNIISFEEKQASIMQPYHDTILHEDILDILFKHKKDIYRKLIDLKGLLLLEHIAITVINPENKLLIFSITPSVEYNLIVQGLWKYDLSFSISFHRKNSFYKWDKAYDANFFHHIKQIKELKHGFTFGCNVAKKVDNFTLIYSFATRSHNDHLSIYYHDHINDLIAIGDYGYNTIRNLYANYYDSQWQSPPNIHGTQNKVKKPLFKLIVNNNKK